MFVRTGQSRHRSRPQAFFYKPTTAGVCCCPYFTDNRNEPEPSFPSIWSAMRQTQETKADLAHSLYMATKRTIDLGLGGGGVPISDQDNQADHATTGAHSSSHTAHEAVVVLQVAYRTPLGNSKKISQNVRKSRSKMWNLCGICCGCAVVYLWMFGDVLQVVSCLPLLYHTSGFCTCCVSCVACSL